ncbi:unnamed protein product [Toxocara canis]|uniref:Uncharacterized protein n=1 Tax=Toxocara canis TaxID=6265 RepID=A0A183UJM0_TOXCA|nr:unnamed protein product [Toxocara canis]
MQSKHHCDGLLPFSESAPIQRAHVRHGSLAPGFSKDYANRTMLYPNGADYTIRATAETSTTTAASSSQLRRQEQQQQMPRRQPQQVD